MMIDPVDNAVDRFRRGYNCAQAVLSAYANDLGLSEDAALRLAGLFGGGMGRRGEVCGAVTGALMVLGLKFGSTTAGDAVGKERQYGVARELMSRFRERRRSILCRELLGCQLSTAEGWQEAQDRGLFLNLCPELIRDAAEIVSQLLRSEPG